MMKPTKEYLTVRRNLLKSKGENEAIVKKIDRQLRKMRGDE